MHLKTERLILRPFEDTDASVIFPLINEADVVRYLLAVPHPHPEDRLLPWMRSAREATRRRERFHFAIVLRETRLPVGDCSFHDVSWENMSAEFGYWLGKPYWGRGYMTEAVRELVRFGFEDLGLERIHARVQAPNIASIRVIEKAGLKLEYIARREVRKDGEFRDMLHYGLIREEYSP